MGNDKELPQAVEALAREIRDGLTAQEAEPLYEIPLLALGPDWDFSREAHLRARALT